MLNCVRHTVLNSFRVCALSLSLLLWCTLPAQAQSILRPVSATPLHRAELLQHLSTARVVYLGEQHDRSADHQAQLEIIQALHQQNPEWAIALEMFQRPYQSHLDQYLAGQIDEAELRRRTEYDQRWGFPWEYYAPILRYARAHQLPLLALNTPTEVTRQVARQGLAGLTDADPRWIPPASEIRTDNATYRQRMRAIYDEIHQGRGRSDRFENFFLAQVLWDETMAAAIAQFLHNHPTRRVVVLAGQGHLVYGDGIPSRVARRISPTTSFQQQIILINPSADLRPRDINNTPVADYFWFNLP